MKDDVMSEWFTIDGFKVTKTNERHDGLLDCQDATGMKFIVDKKGKRNGKVICLTWDELECRRRTSEHNRGY